MGREARARKAEQAERERIREAGRTTVQPLDSGGEIPIPPADSDPPKPRRVGYPKGSAVTAIMALVAAGAFHGPVYTPPQFRPKYPFKKK